ncbi:hypothetical protein [Streptococcus dysgalactiae]|uniref:hypothetical protein n=1 Tax=Streptococcus dysgalactiae TaxID=1334 RepID=UPI00194DDFE9|nr:hypothetical protein [Streptococcus dysgalactiae]
MHASRFIREINYYYYYYYTIPVVEPNIESHTVDMRTAGSCQLDVELVKEELNLEEE